MEMPSVSRVLIDTRSNVRYEVLSYRPLSEDELIGAVRMKRAMMKKKPRPNSVCQIVTMIGLID